jgi:hypothetical protein
LICTTTLAEGVNLPIRTLVVHTIRRFSGQQLQPLPNRTIKNIIGRAGRAGKEIRGRIIFVNDSEEEQVLQILRDQRMESAHGALFNLVKAISVFLKRNNIRLDNEIIDQQSDPEFLSLIDSIDFTLLELIPAETPQEDINNHIDELLDKTLAKVYCDTLDLKECLNTIFRLRAKKLKDSVAPETWKLLRRTGASPRLWSFVDESQLLRSQLWKELIDPLDDRWLNEIILEVIKFPSLDIDVDAGVLLKVIRGWISGRTYQEISVMSDITVDDVIEIICSSIGYKLQDHVSKLCQLAIALHGENEVSEIARNWAALLQYGLGTLQQLDFFDRGASDRSAVWGVSRFLKKNEVALRNVELLGYLRANKKEVRSALRLDKRVPILCENRFLRELKI